MRFYNYNDEQEFKAKNLVELHQKIDGYIKIPIYYGIDDDDTIMLDIESIKEEFERTLSGIEIVIDEITDKHQRMKVSED